MESMGKRQCILAKLTFLCVFFIAFLCLAHTFCVFSPASAWASDISFITDVGEEGISPYMQELSKVRERVVACDFEKRVEVMNFAFACGHSKESALFYAFPEVVETINNIEKKLYVAPKNATLESIKGSGKVRVVPEKKGKRLKRDALVDEIFGVFNTNMGENYKFNAETEEVECEVTSKSMENCTNLRGGFQTTFATSSAERKHNIELALSCLDGKIVMPNETMSFNKTTGARGESGGYQKAKIIKNGMFVTEFGGGVCQVSSTLYNACLLSDLEIVEVHPHSLPVSYVAPCFDAMVNSGSADLVIKNTTGYPIIIATSLDNDTCKINIYGCKNNYKIVRNSEKIEDLLQITTEKTKNYKDFGLTSPLEKGEERVISSGKPGYKAVGKLLYYQNGVLVKTQKIRENTYAPTKRVVLVG